MPTARPQRARLPADFATSAAYPLFAIDPQRDLAWVLQFGPDDYRQAGFLDRRALRPGIPGWEVSRQELALATGNPRAGLPVHWLFHIGHGGSTLCSRLLDLLPGVLGLREPLPLLALAHGQGQPTTMGWLEPVSRLLARGFDDTRAVVVKPTSVVTTLAAPLLAATGGCGCLLWIDLQSWLATMLRAPALVESALAQAPLRLAGMAMPAPAQASEATRLAQLWLAEQVRWRRLCEESQLAGRLVELDFAQVLADPSGRLAELAKHFGLEAPADWAARVADSGLLGRYAKDERQAFDGRQRERELATSLQEHHDAIEATLEWAAGALADNHCETLLPRLRQTPTTVGAM